MTKLVALLAVVLASMFVTYMGFVQAWGLELKSWKALAVWTSAQFVVMLIASVVSAESK